MQNEEHEKYLILLTEIRELQKEILNRQERILKNIDHLKDEQKRLWEELQINRFVVEGMQEGTYLLN